MKKEVFKTKLSEATSSYLESFQFEMDGWCHLCQWVQTLDKPKRWIEDEQKYYQHKYDEAKFCRGVVFDEIINELIPKQFQGERFQLTVDFNRSEAIVYENE